METLSLVLSAVIVIIAIYFIYKSKNKTGNKVKDEVKPEEVIDPVPLNVDEVLIDLIDGSYKVLPSRFYKPNYESSVIKTCLKPISGYTSDDIVCSGGSCLKQVKTYFSVRYNTDNLNIETVRMPKDDLFDIVKTETLRVIKFVFINRTIFDLNEKISAVTEEVTKELSKSLLPLGLSVNSISIDITTGNIQLIKSLYEVNEDAPSIDELEDLKRKSEKEIEKAKILSEKESQLSLIDIESAKRNSEKELELKKIDYAKYAQLNSKKAEHDFNEEKRRKEEDLKRAQLQSDTTIKMTEMSSSEQEKIREINKAAKLKSIESEKEAQLAKIDSDLEVSKKSAQSKIEISNLEKEAELNEMKNNVEIEKEELSLEESLHEEKMKSEERKLEISVTLPAMKEAEKNELLAKSKANVKDIDTESTIKTSRAKIEFKKEEESIKSEIKKQQDLNDLEVYEKMLSIASDNPELAIQWKMIEKSVEIAKIQGDSLTKMNLGQITINGSGVNENNMGNLLGNILPMLSQMTVPQVTPQISKKSTNKNSSEISEE